MKKYIFLSLLIFIFSYGLIIDKADAAPKLEVNAEVGINGKVKYYEPVPLKITVTNNGSDFSGDLVIDSYESVHIGSAQVYSLNIAEGETKTLHLTLNALNESSSGPNEKQLFFYEGGIEKGKEINYQGSNILNAYFPNGPDAIFIFTLTENSDRLSALVRLSEFTQSQVEVFHLNDIKGYELPTDSKALSLADFLIVDEVSLSDLTQEQQQAIFDWVQSGGTLLVGASDQISLSMGVFQNFLPLNLSNERITATASNLSNLTNGRFDKNIEILKAVANKDSKIVLKDGNNILAASKKIGNGQIIQTTFSLGDQPLPDMPGYGNLLSFIMDIPHFQNSKSDKSNYYENVSSEVKYINEIFPSFEVTTHWLIIVIIIYILIIGPVLYFVLKRFDKREHAWWIIPTVAIGLSVLMFLFGAKDRMLNAQIQQASYLKVNEDKSLEGYYINSLLTNKNGDYKFETDENTTIAAISSDTGWVDTVNNKLHEKSYIKQHANGSTITFRDLKYWSVQSMSGKSTIKNAGNLDIDISLFNNKIEGTIKNNFPFKLKDVSIWSGGKEIVIGDVEPNKTLKVSEQIKSTTLISPTIPYGMYQVPTKKEEILKYRLSSLKLGLATLVQNEQLPVVIGWTDEPIIGTKMKGKNKIDATNYIIQTFKPKLKLSGEFTLSNEAFVTDLNPSVGSNASFYNQLSDQEWEIEKGEYEYVIKLPEGILDETKNWKALTLSKINSNTRDYQIWNAYKKTYEEFPNQKMEINSNLEQYISNGEIKIKFKFIIDEIQTVRMPDVELKGVAK